MKLDDSKLYHEHTCIVEHVKREVTTLHTTITPSKMLTSAKNPNPISLLQQVLPSLETTRIDTVF